jgi:Ring finger domain
MIPPCSHKIQTFERDVFYLSIFPYSMSRPFFLTLNLRRRIVVDNEIMQRDPINALARLRDERSKIDKKIQDDTAESDALCKKRKTEIAMEGLRSSVTRSIDAYKEATGVNPMDEEDCPICLQKIGGVVTVRLRCTHNVHFKCLSKLPSPIICPVCRAESGMSVNGSRKLFFTEDSPPAPWPDSD